MLLQPIQLAVDPGAWTGATATSGRADPVIVSHDPCGFCGCPVGSWQAPFHREGGSTVIACALCALPQRLERPQIDREAVLVWLPEWSQQAISVLMREVHVRTQALGASLGDDYEPVDCVPTSKTTPDYRKTIYVARTALAKRVEVAEHRLGTTSPHELAVALLGLSAAAFEKRSTLLGGIRLLPLGRFYEVGNDVYPEIVSAWSCGTPPAEQTGRGSNGARATRKG